MNRTQIRMMKSFALLLAGSMTLALTGCALGGYTVSPAGNEAGAGVQGSAIRGVAHGGQTPIAGGKVYLFAAGAPATGGGYGVGATSLLTSAVLTPPTGYTAGGQDGSGNYYTVTNATGYFTISGDYTCPTITANSVTYPAELYLLLTGGDSGGGANANIAEIAALGPCTGGSNLAGAIPFVVVNEVTTAAAVYALQQFMAAPTTTQGKVMIGAPATNLVGLQNAFTTAGNLADITQGTSPTTIGTATPESDKLYTIGNILAHCVNSTSIATDCNALFSSVMPAGTALSTKNVLASTVNPPLDTVAATWYMAQFPANVGGASCGTAGGAFQCAGGVSAPWSANVLASEPNDWTLAVGYAPKLAGVQAVFDPTYIALDFYGNAWITSYGSTTGVVGLSPTGSVMVGPVGSYTVTANSGYAANLVTTYGITSAVSYTRTMNHPKEIRVDSLGNAWLADWNSSLTTNQSAISGGTFSCPTSPCVFGTVAMFPAATGPGVASASGVSGFYVGEFPYGLAGDANGNMYITLAGGSTTYGSKAVGKINAAGTYTLGAAVGTHPYTVVVDNNTTATNGPLVWVNDQSGCTATAGGDASVVVQMTSVTMATTTVSGLTGANTGCISGVHDKITASTGAILGIAFDANNGLWMVNSAFQANGGTAGTTGAMNSLTYGLTTVTSGLASVSTTDTTKSIMTASAAAAPGLGGMSNPQFVAIDGLGNAWVSNLGFAANTGYTTTSPVSEFSVSNAGTASMAINALSGTNGFLHNEAGSQIASSEGVGIDLSGNVWVTNTTSGGTNYVTVLVGAAAPTNPVIPGKLGVLP
ncbi:MAG: hypothetical protein P4L10_12270 [Acidobacteriaceae bacterium]|nr:hypothetical protein [Acidobacteriaceae bacterium]